MSFVLYALSYGVQPSVELRTAVLDEDLYYPNFKIEGTELKKLYFDKEDLNES